MTFNRPRAEREAQIIGLVSARGECTIEELARAMGVSYESAKLTVERLKANVEVVDAAARGRGTDGEA